LWPQTHSGHRWRLRSVQDIANECRFVLENFPGLKEIFFDDDTFNYRKARTIELCAELKKLKFTWSCTSRVTTDYETLKAMKEAGCRLLIVGYESGDQQILKNIKKGATVAMAERLRELGFTRVNVLEWGQSTAVGDIEVHALPFYGACEFFPGDCASS